MEHYQTKKKQNKLQIMKHIQQCDNMYDSRTKMLLASKENILQKYANNDFGKWNQKYLTVSVKKISNNYPNWVSDKQEDNFIENNIYEASDDQGGDFFENNIYEAENNIYEASDDQREDSVEEDVYGASDDQRGGPYDNENDFSDDNEDSKSFSGYWNPPYLNNDCNCDDLSDHCDNDFDDFDGFNDDYGNDYDD